LDGTLDADASSRINVHRKHCKSCDDKLTAMSMNSASRPHEATLVTAHNRDTVIQGFAALDR
jgi:hypothetical protein